MKSIGTPASDNGLEALVYLADWGAPLVIAPVSFELLSPLVADLMLVRNIYCAFTRTVTDVVRHGLLDLSGLDSLEQILHRDNPPTSYLGCRSWY
jgi:hypothetical protein